MKWDMKDVRVSEFENLPSGRSRYTEIYDKIFSLKLGEGFMIETDVNTRDAEKIRKAVNRTLWKRKVSDNYLISLRENKFYCGRVK